MRKTPINGNFNISYANKVCKTWKQNVLWWKLECLPKRYFDPNFRRFLNCKYIYKTAKQRVIVMITRSELITSWKYICNGVKNTRKLLDNIYFIPAKMEILFIDTYCNSSTQQVNTGIHRRYGWNIILASYHQVHITKFNSIHWFLYFPVPEMICMTYIIRHISNHFY